MVAQAKIDDGRYDDLVTYEFATARSGHWHTSRAVYNTTNTTDMLTPATSSMDLTSSSRRRSSRLESRRHESDSISRDAPTLPHEDLEQQTDSPCSSTATSSEQASHTTTSDLINFDDEPELSQYDPPNSNYVAPLSIRIPAGSMGPATDSSSTSSKGKGKAPVSAFTMPSKNTPPAPTRAPPPPPPFNPRDYETVTFRPPIYDINKDKSQQWESDSLSTSRPVHAWESSKRWKCCNCGARTIVEQKVCADLSCNHDRCPEGCGF